MERGCEARWRPQGRILLGWGDAAEAEAELEEDSRTAEKDNRMELRARKDGVQLRRGVSSAAPAGVRRDHGCPVTAEEECSLEEWKEKRKAYARVGKLLWRSNDPLVTMKDAIEDDEPTNQPWDTGADDADEECEEEADLEPFFFDEAEAIADHERRQKKDNKLNAVMDGIQGYDPKQGCVVYNKFNLVNPMVFDHDEESPLGPMRDTDASIEMVGDIVCKEGRKQYVVQGDESTNNALSVKTAASSDVGGKLFVPCDSVNVLSVKIVSSDVGFPIEVYGTVIARDILDLKCVYLFHCDRDHSHIVLNKEEELILIGPKRGLALIDSIHIEIDLKIKGEGKQKEDRQLSKGYLTMGGTTCHLQDRMEIESYPVDSMLSKVVVCAVERHAVEATIAIEVLQGKFYGEITACTAGIRVNSILLHDSRLVSTAAMTGRGALPMLRCVVAVGLMEKLILTVTRHRISKAERQGTIKFTPRINCSDEEEIFCGSLKMRVKVTWSIISRVYLV